MQKTHSSSFDVCAIGNALVDVIANCTDDFLQANGIAKGAMTLIDADRAGHLYDVIGPAVEISGGAAANTVAGIASFGGNPAYMGKVKADQLGAIFRHDMHALGVHFATSPLAERRTHVRNAQSDGKSSCEPVSSQEHALHEQLRGDDNEHRLMAHEKWERSSPTGRCLILVTPDAQRSMSTYLGAAVEFSVNDIQPEVIQASEVTYLEGYLFDPPEAQKAFREAAKIVHQAGHLLALSLSDVFCVDRHRKAFLDLVKDEVDILFANQGELLALFETQDLDKAMAAARQYCKIAVTTRSEKGAIIAKGKETVEIKAEPVHRVVDTTGAGDLFAAGFLFGMTRKKSLAECGRLGALAAAEVISHFGPRPQRSLKELLTA